MLASFVSVLWFLLFTFHDGITSPAMEKPTARPVYGHRPFIVGWNVPTQICLSRRNVSLDLRLFAFNASPSNGFVDQGFNIFYRDRLGLYPYYKNNVSINGGLPQNASLSAHLSYMQVGIQEYINKTADEEALSVIDWEEWSPLWARNWNAMDIYRQFSRKLVAARHPTWSDANVSKQAQHEFETAARNFMEQTILHARKLRPHQLWGFYLFPDCYNHFPIHNMESYTGECADVEISRNDQLYWLWEASTALFPSIYLNAVLESSYEIRKFVRFRVKEAMRVANKYHKDYALPVYPYAEITYLGTLDPLSQMDLISTIGESAAQGAAGIIFWGDTDYVVNQNACPMAKSYIDGRLGEYIVNVTTAAEHCSRFLCNSNGRCLRKADNTDSFLHLNPDSFRIVHAPKDVDTPMPMWAEGELSTKDKHYLSSNFRCQCYVDWNGDNCGTKESISPRSGATGLRGGHMLLGSLLALLLLQL
ncbi:hypothetical protein GDO78_020503 [Eleutherodactylus coqui]|uniref:Hyaluronidase n=1 Tax=Eleutherodactylus coqui TaxID=57060 RepID=A0A8J6ENP4_ELECQ|nr:hypothetical protein GDO78_020503 [Eleutherodactylus coqui]